LNHKDHKEHEAAQLFVTFVVNLFFMLTKIKNLASLYRELGPRWSAFRLAYAFRLCTSRRPTAAESQVLLALLAKEQRRIAEGWVGAREISGARVPPPNATPTQLAAWTVVSRVILNLDETITKE
jgi:hypothetical protein